MVLSVALQVSTVSGAAPCGVQLMDPQGWGNPAGRVDTPASPVLPLKGAGRLSRWLNNTATCGARPSWLPLGVSISDSSSEELEVPTHQWASTGQYALKVLVNANRSRSGDDSRRAPYTYRLWTAWRQNATDALRPLLVSSR